MATISKLANIAAASISKVANILKSAIDSVAGVLFSGTPASTSVVVAHTTIPYVSAYPWSSGFGTKYSNPGTLPSGQGNFVDFN